MHTLNSMGSLTISGQSQGGSGQGHGLGMGMGKDSEVVPVGFDEGILRGLCEMDVSPTDIRRSTVKSCGLTSSAHSPCLPIG